MNQVQKQISKTDFYKEKLQEAIQSNKISNWDMHIISKKRNNVYVEKDYQIESLLSSSREEIMFHIYKEFGEELGESSFTLNENSTNEEFEQELEDAIFICSQGKSKNYVLPNVKDNNVKDDDIDYSNFYDEKFFEEFSKKTLNLYIAEKLAVFKKLIEEAQEENLKVTLNAFEFHNTIFEHSLENSNEIEKSYKKNSSYMEFVLTTHDIETNKETEFIIYEKIGDLFSYNFENYFKQTIVYAKDSAVAKEALSFTGNILLKDKSALDFFNPDLTMNSLVGHASGRLKFQGVSEYEIGKEILKANKDKLTISLNPTRAHNYGSAPYDGQGISGRKVTLIEKGVFKSHFTSKKYADYLGIEATGPVAVIEVEGGEKTSEELTTEEYVEIISFASFVPDMISGDYSSEIRLGYHVKNGVKTPFKGGLFSGNIFKVCEDIELSKEIIDEAGYVGPKVIKLHKGEIVGL